MPLRVLDGNQTATTLSSVVTGGEHIVAHTVVSLGATAIANIASAVSGVPIAGTVTANGFNYDENAIEIIPIRNDGNDSRYIPVGPSFNDAGDSITLPISGTVTANGGDFSAIVGESMPAKAVAIGFYSGDDAGIAQVDDSNRRLPISGTVTANLSSSNLNAVTVGIRGVVTASINGSASATSRGPITTVDDNVPADPKYMMSVGGMDYSSNQWRTFNLDGGGRSVVTVSNFPATQAVSLTSTTVTVSALPGGALTTQFGSVTTANTAQMTSAVTNTSRKYLLAQNISAGTVTIGIGFSPTTTQGIQLTAGAGITFESSYIPTGAVYVLSSVTASNFTILEA